MRIATFILSLFLVMPMTVQSCALFLLPGEGSGAGAIGLLTVMLTVVALAFVLAYPLVASVLYVAAAIIAFLGSTTFGDLMLYSIVLLVLAVMAFIGWLNKPGSKRTTMKTAGTVQTNLVTRELQWVQPEGIELTKVPGKELYDLLNRPAPLHLVGIDLSKVNLVGANLVGANLRQANLEGTNLRQANLVGAHLAGANMRGAYLIEANLAGADLTQANLSGAYVMGANLQRALLGSAILAGTQLYGANLEAANLIGANLESANLRRATLTGARLYGANMKGADLTFADLRKTDWKQVVFDETTVWPEFYKPPKRRR